jgi:hypothetical protein
MKLWELAQVKIGDTGNISHITLSAYDKGDYLLMRDKVTPERVKRWLGPLVKGEIVRFELPHYWLMHFVMSDTSHHRKERTDAAKSMSAHLRNMDI